jgi:hypothetical protein
MLKAYYGEMDERDMLKQWQDRVGDVYARNMLVEGMKYRDIRPALWTYDRETKAGLYPDIQDPDFVERLSQKTEFADLRSQTVSDEICGSKESFDTTPVQRLVARFLHPSTPYKGLLLDHGVGVGKTCSAITVAEMYLEMMPHNQVIILCPQAIASGFRRTIFDAKRLLSIPEREAQLRGEVWESFQCTGMTYPRLTGMAQERKLDVVKSAVDGAIRKRYMIMGYLAFANWVQGKLNEVPRSLEGEARTEAETQILYNLFSDRLIIVDEAHNLRDIEGGGVSTTGAEALLVDETDATFQTAAADAAEGKRLTPILRRILKSSEGLRLMMMTATPMYNTAPEILFLMNLLILNDLKDETKLLRTRDFFGSDGALLPAGHEVLKRICSRYISYMRGENPASFPLRLTPPTAAGSSLFVDYPTHSISKAEGTVKIADGVKKVMEILPLIVHKVSPTESYCGKQLYTLLKSSKEKQNDGGASEVSEFVLDQTMQTANIAYPDGSFGSRGWDTNWKEGTVRGNLRQFIWNPDEEETNLQDVFVGKGLQSHAPKIAAIVDSVTKAKGMVFVFSRYVKAGALPIAIALECAGWTRVLSDGTALPLLRDGAISVERQCAFCVNKESQKHEGHVFTPANFVLLTGDDRLSPHFRETLEYANTLTTPDDLRGGKVKAILGSQIASEGLDLKCIRENHLLDGWYHLNRIEQVIGRAVRYCSHAALPIEQRNCLIYLHAVSVPEYETGDLYAYRVAARKAIPIGEVQRIIKTSAWDCLMNRDAVLLRGLKTRLVEDAQGRRIPKYDPHDRPYTSICDFQKACEYTCTAKIDGETVKNTSTYQEFDARRRFLEKQTILRRLFGTEDVMFPLDEIRKTVYGDMPWEIGAVGLRAVLGNPQFVIQRRDGIRGTLVLRNGYVVFQPLHVTDPDIPLALRYGRAYGRVPRSMDLMRKIFDEKISTAMLPTVVPVPKPGPLPTPGPHPGPLPAPGPQPGPEPPQPASPTESLDTLRTWKLKLEDVFGKELKQTIKPPEGMKKVFFEGWRTVFYLFRKLPETGRIAEQWWMDTEWSLEQRGSVLKYYVQKSPLTESESQLLKGYQPAEYFRSELSGYRVFNSATKKIETYCYLEGDASPQICPGNLLSEVEKVTGPPVDRKTQTGPAFGFLIPFKGSIVFKSVVKSDDKEMKGAMCFNTSNLDNHTNRVKIIQSALREMLPADHAILDLLLDDDPANKVSEPEKARRQSSGELMHITDLTKNQVCSYMEFLLRWSDIHRVGGKRWFLSVVEAILAGTSMKDV